MTIHYKSLKLSILTLFTILICYIFTYCDSYEPDHTEVQDSIILSKESTTVKIKPKAKKLQRILDKVIISPKKKDEYITAVRFPSHITYYPPFEDTSGVTTFPASYLWLSVSKDDKYIIFNVDPDLAMESDIKTLYVIARAKYDGYSDDAYIWKISYE